MELCADAKPVRLPRIVRQHRADEPRSRIQSQLRVAFVFEGEAPVGFHLWVLVLLLRQSFRGLRDEFQAALDGACGFDIRDGACGFDVGAYGWPVGGRVLVVLSREQRKALLEHSSGLIGGLLAIGSGDLLWNGEVVSCHSMG